MAAQLVGLAAGLAVFRALEARDLAAGFLFLGVLAALGASFMAFVATSLTAAAAMF